MKNRNLRKNELRLELEKRASSAEDGSMAGSLKELSLLVLCPKVYDNQVTLSRCIRCPYFQGTNHVEINCGYTGKPNGRGLHPKNTLNELEGNEWLFFTKSVLRTSYPSEYGHELRKQHGANKPPQLMKHIIEFFTKRGETVLDPFCGVGGTLLGASLCERKATGIELNGKWLDVYEEVCKRERIKAQETIEGDCLRILDEMREKGRKFDFVATDPPYSIAIDKTMCDGKYEIQHRRTDFNKFSDDGNDFRNLLTFEEYYAAIEEAARKIYYVLEGKRYFVVIIRDSYQGGKYIMASYEVSERIKRAGFIMKGIKIWYGTGARVRPYGYPFSYVPNIVHQNILIFRRKD